MTRWAAARAHTLGWVALAAAACGVAAPEAAALRAPDSSGEETPDQRAVELELLRAIAALELMIGERQAAYHATRSPAHRQQLVEEVTSLQTQRQALAEMLRQLTAPRGVLYRARL